MSEELEKEKKLSSTNAQCENCGGNLRFDPVSQSLKCPNCDSYFPFDKKQGENKHFIQNTNERDQEHDEWAKDMKVVKCSTCGASVVLNGLDITQCCPYCGSDYVIDKDQMAGLKPDIVIPFAYNEEEASERFVKGIKKKFFAPRAFKKKLPANKIHGIYIPTFTFDADTFTHYVGELEKTETKKDRKGNTIRYTKRFKISGTKDNYHRDYVVESSSKINQKDMNKLLPFDFGQSYVYSNNFLRGYQVEHYEDPMKECYYKAQSAMSDKIKKDILSKYSYSRVVSFHMDINWSNELYAYRLMPVYCLDFDYKGKHYTTLMNGQTGKIGTGYPQSILKKIALGFIIAAVIIGILVLLFFLSK